MRFVPRFGIDLSDLELIVRQAGFDHTSALIIKARQDHATIRRHSSIHAKPIDFMTAPPDRARCCHNAGNTISGPLVQAIGTFVLRDELDNVADGLQLARFLVTDGDLELVLEIHDQLNRIEAVGVEILGESSVAGDVVFINAHLLGNDLDDR